jgi:serine phosphatase RsbU (regulator of sigma subunit)
MARQINDFQGVIRCLHNIGMGLSRKGQPRRALQYYQEALDLSRANSFKHLEANTLSNMAGVNNDLSQFRLALNQAMESLKLSQEIQSLEDQLHAYRNISKAHEGLGDFKRALEYHKYFKYFNDSITSIENRREVSRIEAVFQNEKMHQEIDLKNTLIEKQVLEMEQQSAMLKRQRLVRNVLIFGSVLLAAFAAAIYLNLRRRKKINALIIDQKQQIEHINNRLLKQNEEITCQHDEITRQKAIIEKNNNALVSSIRYAQNIQKSLLPEEDVFPEIFKEHFLIYEPKEIVSGDFYWVGRQNGTTLLAIADSTGHGVPGAFLSLMGISFLNEYIARRKYQSPSQLLDEMRLFFISSLHQQEGKNDQKDGIEMACIAIDHQNSSLVYSGAKMPIYIASNKPVMLNQNISKAVWGKIHKVSGDRMPISFHKKMVPFKNHTLMLNEGDMLYIMSDGFADQFKHDEAVISAGQSERFSSQRFLKLLNEIYFLTANQQRETILESLHNWKKDSQQVDDITVIGIRV